MASHTVLFRHPFVALALALLMGASLCSAADPRDRPRGDEPDQAARKGIPRADETVGEVDQQEQMVLRMVDRYLPEIKRLLDQLRVREPRQYDVAIRNLARSAKRLEWAKKRGEEAFELEVNVVQAQSAINLLIAKLKIRDSQNDRQSLRAAAKQLAAAELARSDFELAQMQTRLKRLKDQVSVAEQRLEEKKSTLDETIERSFQTYLKKSGQK